MCGIAGFVDSSLSHDRAGSLIEEMLESIAHRGPDARGKWTEGPVTLGHNRLSIIDLSPEGNQPLENFDAMMIFNGEVYNYVEIREELKKKGYQFRTQTDSEVVLAAYREYGDDCVQHFVGMWSLAIWDKKRKRLFCSRDRFGIKPFYYLESSGKLYFGSEYKALRKSPLFKKELNMDQIARSIQLGWLCYKDETFYQSLKALPASHNLVWEDGKISTHQYWTLKIAPNESRSFEENRERFHEMFHESVRIHMRSDVEIAILLSGGLDSSSLSGTVCQEFPQKSFRTFSAYYDKAGQVDERPFIYPVIEKYPQLKPTYISPKTDAVEEYLYDIVDKTDVPPMGSSNFSLYFLSKEIHEHGVKVVVDGQGADEYLAGYMHSFYRHHAGMMKKLRLGALIRSVGQLKREQRHSFGNLMKIESRAMASALKSEQNLFRLEYKHALPFPFSDYSKIPFQLEEVHSGKLDNFLYQLIFYSSLPTILHYVDRMTMAFSLESRVPFLDHRLVEFGFTLGENQKIHGATTKYILREAMKDTLPPEVYNRKDKKGFVTPGETQWLRGQLKHMTELDYSLMPFLNRNKVQKIIDDYHNGDNRYVKQVWRISSLNYWLKNF